jgi:hypothetical protein
MIRKKEIVNHYGRTRISENLVKQFKNDLASGKVIINMAENGYYCIQ